MVLSVVTMMVFLLKTSINLKTSMVPIMANIMMVATPPKACLTSGSPLILHNLVYGKRLIDFKKDDIYY